MQHPTCTGTHVRTPADAHIIFHAVSLGVLPMISRRLDTDERRAIQSGCIYIWEERGAANGTTEPMGLGIERWTDSIRWGPSRVREEFLFYHEREPDAIDIDLSYDSESASPLGYTPTHALLRENLIKQTYSVFVETAHGRRKWHLIAYFTQDSVDYLRTVEEIPQLACIRVPPGMYTSARSVKGAGRTYNTSNKYAGVAAAGATSSLFCGGGLPYAYSRRPNPRPQPQQYQIPPPPPYAPPPAYVVYAPYPVPARYPAPPVTAPPLITASVSPPGFPLTSASPGTATPTRRTPSSSTHDLPPLEFLESMPPPCRHPLDEKALMSFPLKLGSTHQITPEFGRAQKGN